MDGPNLSTIPKRQNPCLRRINEASSHWTNWRTLPTEKSGHCAFYEPHPAFLQCKRLMSRHWGETRRSGPDRLANLKSCIVQILQPWVSRRCRRCPGCERRSKLWSTQPRGILKGWWNLLKREKWRARNLYGDAQVMESRRFLLFHTLLCSL